MGTESTSTSSSSKGESSSSKRVKLRKIGHAREELTPKVVAEGTIFPGTPERSDI